MISNVREHLFQVGARIEVAQFSRADEALHRSGSFSTAVGEVNRIAPAKGYTSHGIFGAHVAYLRGHHQRIASVFPAIQRVVNRFH
jgi:hypothetical protein